MELLGSLQIRVQHLIWKNGPSTVHDVHAAINAQNKAAKTPDLAYTTILTVMRNMAKRGFLDQRSSGARAHTFYPLVTRATYTDQMLTHVRDTLFDGQNLEFERAVSEMAPQ